MRGPPPPPRNGDLVYVGEYLERLHCLNGSVNGSQLRVDNCGALLINPHYHAVWGSKEIPWFVNCLAHGSRCYNAHSQLEVERFAYQETSS